MALTDNQVSSTVQSQLGRPATDHEIQTLKVASPQTLATLKDTHSQLNPNSLSDYLQMQGQDNSLSARTALGSKYGINNIGTAEGNTALLNALKSGKQPTTPTVTGSIAPKTDPGTTQTTDTTTTQPTGNGTLTGSISGATGTTPTTDTPVNDGTIDTNPDVVTARSNVQSALSDYKSAQSQVAQIDQQINQLRAAMNSSLQQKIASIASSGGVVDEGALSGEMSVQNQAIQTQINSLMEQRSQYATAQTQAQQNLTQARADQKDAEANFYKSGNLSVAQQKLEQSGTKIEKVAQYDSYGNKTDDKLVMVNLDGTQTPLSTTSTGALDSSSITAITSAPAGSPQAQSAQAIKSVSTPAYATKFTGNGDAPTDTNQNVKVPGTTLTIGSLYQSALDWMAKPLSSTGSRGTKTIAINTNAAIAEKGAAILQSLGISKTDYESAFKANSSALAQQMKTYSALSVNEKSATLNFGVLLKLSQKADSSVWTLASPVINNWIRTGSVLATGNQDVNNFVSQLTLAMTEYAKVITGQTGGAAVTDSARGEASSLLSAGFSHDGIKSFYDSVVTPDINNRVSAAKSTIQQLTSGISTGTPGVGTDSPTTTTSTPTPTLTTDQYSQYASQLQNGEVLATDGKGNIVGATQDEIKSGAYTPINQPQ